MIRRPPRSTLSSSSAASDVYKRQVGGVAVHQHVDVGLHVGEHAPHHVAFALALFLVNLGTGGARRRGGIVRRIVVEYEDRGGGQRGAEVLYNFRDCHLLVIARHQHGDRVLVEAARLRRGRGCSSFRQSEPPCPSAASICGKPTI